VNERERLFQRFDRVQKIENPICVAVAFAGLACFFLYMLVVEHVITDWWFTPWCISFVLAKFVFALWSARLARAMKALAAEEKIPAAHVRRSRRAA
jgi:hypothetical protein